MAPQPPTSLLVEAYRGCEGLPLVGGLFTRGRVEAKAVLSHMVAAVLDELDLTEIIRDKLQTEAVDAVIARIDLVALADQVIDGVDLPAIIRASTTTVTADVVTDVRAQGDGFVDRMRGRRERLRGRQR
ncbi:MULTISPECIES: hypothetical protein [Mycolicibacterium]|jgi:hypothetical protein|uniref:Uncharacterized protein n=1 Tax=Mycolicibacterium poriferae TaxID=39694 RepID=A0A6N4V2T2_9MYCO|nr:MULTISPECIES: hypothetical protein [Mycolicibacterium]MCG7581585.1 hypothetical protein [Mycolicibacterium sp. OfavD-34-C]QFS94211.1 hypothetical protein FIV07_25950 [Mycobacterium sp. THAF192]BBX49225.1 hypothetical protein MPOR_02510 [Mycolicibacterium poriferae]